MAKHNESFQNTHWSMVERARSDATLVRREALQDLLSIYMPVLHHHLVRRRGVSAEMADELVQGFVVKNVLEGQLIERADQNAGRFRSWLLKWLDNYVRHQRGRHRREQATAEVEAPVEDTDVDAFDLEWARATLGEALRIMEAECREQDKDVRWKVFQQRLLAPFLQDSPPTEYEQLQQQLGLDSTAQAQNILVTAKRHFQRALEQVVGRYAETEEDVQGEIAQLRGALSRLGGDQSAPAEQPSVAGIYSIVHARPDQMARFLDLDPGAIWRRCLSRTVAELIGREGDNDAFGLLLGELLSAAQPAEPVLVAVKEFGNARVQAETTDVPTELGLAMYLSAIAAGLIRLDRRITQSPDSALRSGFQWLLNRDWLDPQTRELIQQANDRLE